MADTTPSLDPADLDPRQHLADALAHLTDGWDNEHELTEAERAAFLATAQTHALCAVAAALMEAINPPTVQADALAEHRASVHQFPGGVS